MKIRYDREEDVLMIKASNDSIDYAEEVGPVAETTKITSGG